MTNSNSFNICSRCGTANSLNAKYCYSCGSQLKVPEEPVVCHNCHSVNTSMANFCRTCGATLKVGQQTKICPRCRKEVKIDQNQCNCGYSFATVSAVNPVKDPIDPRTGVSYHGQTAAADSKADKPKKTGGRVAAIFAFLLVAAFIYVLFAPTGILATEIPFLSNWQLEMTAPLNMVYLDMGGGTVVMMSFLDFAMMSINALDALEIGGWIALCLIAVAAAFIVLYLVVSIVRIFTGKRSKKGNMVFFILGIVYTLVAIFSLLVLFEVEFAANLWLVDLLLPPPGYGWCVLAGFFLIAFLFSLVAKKKGEKVEKVKKQKPAKK